MGEVMQKILSSTWRRVFVLLIAFAVMATSVSFSFAETAARSGEPSVSYRFYLSGSGWGEKVSDGRTAGAAGSQAAALKVWVSGDTAGSVQYSAFYGGAWSGWTEKGVTCGGSSKKLEIVKIKLTGALAKQYDIYYAVYLPHYGWMNWAKNGASAGTKNHGYVIQAMRVQLVPKGGAAPAQRGSHDKALLSMPTAAYQGYVAGKGWGSKVDFGGLAGQTDEVRSMEAFRVNKFSTWEGGSLQYAAFMEKGGWQSWKDVGETAGLPGDGKRMDKLRLRLTGQMAKDYDVYYCVYVQKYGWLGWVRNGDAAGLSENHGFRIEAVRVKILPNGAAAPEDLGSHSAGYLDMPKVWYQSAVSNAWQDPVASSSLSGMKGKLLDGFRFTKLKKSESGTIEVNANYGGGAWSGYKGVGEKAGKTGRRTNQLKIHLTGALKSDYDVYYATYVKDVGWLQWAKNGEVSGVEPGADARIEAVRVKILPKGADAPADLGKTPYKNLTEANYRIYTSPYPYKRYVWIQIESQTLTYYEDGEVVVTTPVITGRPGWATPTGHFHVTSKVTDCWLEGDTWRSHVDYWIAFIGHSTGIHDSWWHSTYGGNIYKTNRGSHGCVNTPYQAVKTIFGKIHVGDPVIITAR